MKKNRLMIATTVICAALFTACTGSNANDTTNGSSANNEVNNDTQVETTSTTTEDVKMLYGEITEVIGNALTVKEIEMPEGISFGGNLGDMGDQTEFTLPDGTVVPVGEDGKLDFSGIEMPEGMTFDENGGGRVMFTPGADGEMPEMPTDIQGGMTTGEGGTPVMRSIERTYTGEEVEVFVPVGIPVMTRTRGENGIEETELALNNIKAGDIITVTYKEDGKTIDTVFVQQSGTAGGMGGMMMGGGNMEFFPMGDGGMAIQAARP